MPRTPDARISPRVIFWPWVISRLPNHKKLIFKMQPRRQHSRFCSAATTRPKGSPPTSPPAASPVPMRGRCLTPALASTADPTSQFPLPKFQSVGGILNHRRKQIAIVVIYQGGMAQRGADDLGWRNAMCEKCVEIDKKIVRYRRLLAVMGHDKITVEGTKELLADLEAQKFALHPEQEPPPSD